MSDNQDRRWDVFATILSEKNFIMDENTKKMLAGKAYRPDSKELSQLRARAHDLCTEYNGLMENDSRREKIIDELFTDHKKGVYIQGPMRIDYGKFTHLGENFYANFNLTILDTCPVTIGNNVLIGPNCTIATPLHPLLASQRNAKIQNDGKFSTIEYGAPVEIGDNCWLASNVTVTSGVTIGAGCVIGAGAVVTNNIPENSLVLGVPGKVVRTITEADRIKDWPY